MDKASKRLEADKVPRTAAAHGVASQPLVGIWRLVVVATWCPLNRVKEKRETINVRFELTLLIIRFR